MRNAAGMTLESIVCKLYTDSRKWVKEIFHVISYLAAKGLSLSGEDESHEFNQGLSGGLFLDTIQNLVFQLSSCIENTMQR